MNRKSYSEKLLDPRWQQMRLRVFERDGWACKVCEASGETLHAHHVHYHPYAEGPWDYDVDTIITLCSECHSHEHDQLDVSKASVILALAKIGYVTAFDFDCLVDIFSNVSKDDLHQIFTEKNHGKN